MRAGGEGIDVTRLTREVKPKSPFELNLMRITVDGQPIDDPARSSADIQRCTDVAFDNAAIELQFDNLQARPRLSVAASPASVPLATAADGSLAGPPVRFRTYTNYPAFIARSEVRILEAGRSLQSTPLQVLEVDGAGFAEWQAGSEPFAGPVRELVYVLRAYDAQGNFDETSPQPLWLVTSTSPTAPRCAPCARRPTSCWSSAPASASTTAGGCRRRGAIPGASTPSRSTPVRWRSG